MSRPQDFFGAAPKTVLNKPFMHVQDQKPNGTDGGASVAGFNDRTLNTVLSNSISGGSLSSNIISLPAGEYYVEGWTVVGVSTGGNRNVLRLSSGSILLTGGRSYSSAADNNKFLHISGTISLSSSSDIKLSSEVSGASANGLGDGTTNEVNLDDTGINVFSDLKIWQLDADVKTPVASSAQAYNGQAYLTGGITGLELSKSAANTIDVTAGSCMDSTNTVALGLSAAEIGVAVPTTINTVFNVFLVKYSGGTFGVEVDTDVDGVNLPGTVDKFRWIGFVRNNSSGVIIDFEMTGDILNPVDILDFVLATGIGTSYTQVSPSSTLPVSRIGSIFYAATTSSNAVGVLISLDGVNSLAGVIGYVTFYSTLCPVVADINPYFKTTSGTVSVYVAVIKLKR